MITEKELNEILAKILASNEFHESKRHQELLTYLAHESLKSDSIKETTIAHEIFGRDADFDPAKDTLVRSYISTLRKKLEHYYLTTEDSYSYKFEIPKGQYLVKFTKPEHKINKGNKYFPVYIAVISVLSALALFLFFNSTLFNSGSNEKYIAPNAVWNELVAKSDQPTLIVFGDYFFLSEKKQNPDREVYLRDPGINSEEDFQKFSKEHPQYIDKLKALNFTYLRQSSYLGLAEILPILMKSNNPIQFKSASQLKWEDFDNNNIVFIGPFKTLHILNTLLANTNIKCNIYPPTLSIMNDQGDTVSTLNLNNMRGGNYQRDYGTVFKLRGSKNNVILLLVGFGEAGVMNAVQTSIDPKLIQKLKDFSKTEIQDSPLYFEVITEIEGVDQTVFRSEIKYFKLLPKAYKQIKN